MLQRLFDSAGFTVRLLEWIATLPAWLRPAVYGALLIVLFMGMRGAFVVGPILLVLLLLKSHAPLADLALILLCVGLAVVGGALSGLLYSLIGRWVARIPLLGPYLAGILTVVPYMAVVAVIVQLSDYKPLHALGKEDLVIAGIMSVIFGPFVGYWFLRPGALDAP